MLDSYILMSESLLTEKDVLIASLIGDIIGAIFLIICFILKGFAIRYIAKQKGLKNLWMSFIPFLNFYLLGKVLGKAIIWGLQINNVGLWLAIVAGVQFVLNSLLSFGYYDGYLELFGYTVEYTSKFLQNLANGEGYFYLLLYYVSGIVDLAYIFLHVSFVFLAFRKFNPRKAILFAVLSIFIDGLFGILLFASRKNKQFSYEEYLHMNRRSYYGYYGGGYYGPQQPNNNPNANGEEQKQPEDPFPEFENKNDNDNNSNDFFS
ncbi:MAG: hypothetical protein J6R29_07610 [Clostridia bacterium]|nr:hypothetical protein [Clostridia bacterium]